jgi:hypothetical protein
MFHAISQCDACSRVAHADPTLPWMRGLAHIMAMCTSPHRGPCDVKPCAEYAMCVLHAAEKICAISDLSHWCCGWGVAGSGISDQITHIWKCVPVFRVCPGSPRCLFTGTCVSRFPRCLFTGTCLETMHRNLTSSACRTQHNPPNPVARLAPRAIRNASGLDCCSIRGTKHSGYQRCKV